MSQKLFIQDKNTFQKYTKVKNDTTKYIDAKEAELKEESNTLNTLMELEDVEDEISNCKMKISILERALKKKRSEATVKNLYNSLRKDVLTHLCEFDDMTEEMRMFYDDMKSILEITVVELAKQEQIYKEERELINNAVNASEEELSYKKLENVPYAINPETKEIIPLEGKVISIVRIDCDRPPTRGNDTSIKTNTNNRQPKEKLSRKMFGSGM